MKSLKLSSNMEDYLESIYNLEKFNKVARVKDIAQWLQVKMPSVSGALRVLSRKNLIKHERHGYVELTASGRTIAEQVQQKHQDLTDFFTGVLRINPAQAARDACRVEHVVSRTTMNQIKKFMRKSVNQKKTKKSKKNRYEKKSSR
ncbi:MAG: metal-dependent transcriptional regulator [Planctomycetes bacterium]|nr:metal-dependent transcriptional regulator [Planctomycetota bacterium]